MEIVFLNYFTFSIEEERGGEKDLNAAINEIIMSWDKKLKVSSLCNRDLEIESTHEEIVKMTVFFKFAFDTICTVNYLE